MQTHQVKALLMGGQACVLYGAAEFSRDTDFAVLAEAANLKSLKRALTDLQAQVIAVPPFESAYLEKGHSIHFRCFHPEVLRLRVDVMSRMRGVDEFEHLWTRRTSVDFGDGLSCDLMSLPDLVTAKKTQRDKDWPMVRRLVEANYFAHRQQANETQLGFWLRELRTPELLVVVAQQAPKLVSALATARPLLHSALQANVEQLEAELKAEEDLERSRDREYWQPLKRELERLRHPS